MISAVSFGTPMKQIYEDKPSSDRHQTHLILSHKLETLRHGIKTQSYNSKEQIFNKINNRHLDTKILQQITNSIFAHMQILQRNEQPVAFNFPKKQQRVSIAYFSQPENHNRGWTHGMKLSHNYTAAATTFLCQETFLLYPFHRNKLIDMIPQHFLSLTDKLLLLLIQVTTVTQC